MARNSLPLPYTRSTTPIFEGGNDKYLQEELSRVEVSIASILRMTPQPATAAPKTPIDGMIRLARSPWHPASGQTTDAWVWFDGTAEAWKLL